MQQTPFVSEVGLDGSSRVPLEVQQITFEAVLSKLQSTPRITSIHSYGATEAVLDCLTARPVPGAVLHWWLGSAAQTRRAVELGCYFSVNAAMQPKSAVITAVPPERLLTETDHPFGDRRDKPHARPGRVEPVERAIAHARALDASEVRLLMWQNLAGLVRATRVDAILPRRVRVELLALGHL